MFLLDFFMFLHQVYQDTHRNVECAAGSLIKKAVVLLAWLVVVAVYFY